MSATHLEQLVSGPVVGKAHPGCRQLLPRERRLCPGRLQLVAAVDGVGIRGTQLGLQIGYALCRPGVCSTEPLFHASQGTTGG